MPNTHATPAATTKYEAKQPTCINNGGTSIGLHSPHPSPNHNTEQPLPTTLQYPPAQPAAGAHALFLQALLKITNVVVACRKQSNQSIAAKLRSAACANLTPQHTHIHNQVSMQEATMQTASPTPAHQAVHPTAPAAASALSHYSTSHPYSHCCSTAYTTSNTSQ
jgi:hypothetical protein